MEKIAHVGHDLDRFPAGSVEFGKGCRSAFKGACCAVCDRGKRMAKKSAIVVHGRNYTAPPQWSGPQLGAMRECLINLRF